MLGTVPEKGQGPVSPASGQEELVLLHKQPGPVALLMSSSFSQLSCATLGGLLAPLSLTVSVVGMGYWLALKGMIGWSGWPGPWQILSPWLLQGVLQVGGGPRGPSSEPSLLPTGQ